MRADDKLAFFAALARQGATRVLTLKQLAAGNQTPVQLAAGHYMARSAGGTASSTISLSWQATNAAVLDSALALPAAGAAEVANLQTAPGDAWFLLYVSPEYPYLACGWDAAAATLILTRVFP